MKSIIPKFKYILLCLIICVLSFSCAYKQTFKSGLIESKPSSLGINKIFIENDNTEIPLYKARYNFVVRKKTTDAILCEGEATLTTYSNMKVKAEGGAKCKLAEDIDLSNIISDDIERISFEQVKNLGLDARIVWITKYGNSLYDPYKPYVIGPIIQDPDKFKDIDITHDLHVTILPKNSQDSIREGNGKIQIKMLEAGISYKPPYYPQSFDNVVHWGMYATGFDNMKSKADASLYQVYEYYWSTRPLAILKIHIESPLKDFKSGLIGAIGNTIIGDIVVDLDIKEYNLLN